MVIVGLLLLVGMLLVKYVLWSAGKEFDDLSQAANDPEVRHEKIKEISEMINSGRFKPRAYLQRSHLYFFDADYNSAAMDLRLYLELVRDDSEGWAELAECCIRTGSSEEAQNAAVRAVELDPKYSDYRLLLARARLFNGDNEKARDELDAWREISLEKIPLLKEEEIIKRVQDQTAAWMNLYGAAISLVEGRKDVARSLTEKLRGFDIDLYSYDLENDPVLKAVREMKNNV